MTNILHNTFYDRIDMHIAKAMDMIVDDLREQTVPGQIQEMFMNVLRNLPTRHARLLKKEELIMNLFKSAYDDHMKIQDNISRPDTRSWFTKMTESITAAKESFNSTYKCND